MLNRAERPLLYGSIGPRARSDRSGSRRLTGRSASSIENLLDLGAGSKVYARRMGLKVSQLAKKAGVSADAIRYYESLGLLQPAERTESGYRHFGEEAVRRIGFIKDAQSLGLRLSEIGELLKIQDDGACPCGHTKSLIDQRLEQVNREIAVLTELRTELERLSALECFSAPDSNVWPCEIELKRGGDQSGS